MNAPNFPAVARAIAEERLDIAHRDATMLARRSDRVKSARALAHAFSTETANRIAESIGAIGGMSDCDAVVILSEVYRDLALGSPDRSMLLACLADAIEELACACTDTP